MTAGEQVFHQRNGEARVRRIADHRFVETQHVGRTLRQWLGLAGLTRIGLNGQIDGRQGRRTALARAACCRVPLGKPDNRLLDANETADDEGEVARGARGVEGVRAPTVQRISSGLDFPGSAQVARRHATVQHGHGDANLRCRVVADRRLWIPVAAIAIEKAGLRSRHREVFRKLGAPIAGVVLSERERFAIGRLGFETPRIGDGQRQLGVLRQQRRQVHQESVLIGHPEVEEATEPVADDRAHNQAICKPNRELTKSRRPCAQTHLGPALDPLPVWQRRHVDVVVEHVEGREVVFAVEAPAIYELLLRGIHRNVLVAPPLEHRDVFWLVRRSRVGERRKALGANLREEVVAAWEKGPRITREVGEIDSE